MPLPSDIFDDAGRVKDYARSFPVILAHAKEGDTVAQSLVGYCYLTGTGTQKSSAEARGWLVRAAKNADCEAMCNLGLMFETGDGVTGDRRRAFHWYKMAANAGDAFAQVNLGLMYLSARRPNPRMGVEWLKKAAGKGDPRALYNLGVAYMRGDGVKKSFRAGERCLQKAADLGDVEARTYLEGNVGATVGRAG